MKEDLSSSGPSGKIPPIVSSRYPAPKNEAGEGAGDDFARRNRTPSPLRIQGLGGFRSANGARSVGLPGMNFGGVGQEGRGRSPSPFKGFGAIGRIDLSPAEGKGGGKGCVHFNFLAPFRFSGEPKCSTEKYCFNDFPPPPTLGSRIGFPVRPSARRLRRKAALSQRSSATR